MDSQFALRFVHMPYHVDPCGAGRVLCKPRPIPCWVLLAGCCWLGAAGWGQDCWLGAAGAAKLCEKGAGTVCSNRGPCEAMP